MCVCVCVCAHPAGSAVALPCTCVYMDPTFCTCSWSTTLHLTNTVTETSTCARRHTYDIRTSFSRVGKKVAGRLREWQMWSASGSRHFIRCRSWRWVCESVIGNVRVVHAWHLARARWRSVLGPGGMDRWLACLLGRVGRVGEGWQQ